MKTVSKTSVGIPRQDAKLKQALPADLFQELEQVAAEEEESVYDYVCRVLRIRVQTMRKRRQKKG